MVTKPARNWRAAGKLLVAKVGDVVGTINCFLPAVGFGEMSRLFRISSGIKLARIRLFCACASGHGHGLGWALATIRTQGIEHWLRERCGQRSRQLTGLLPPVLP